MSPGTMARAPTTETPGASDRRPEQAIPPGSPARLSPQRALGFPLVFTLGLVVLGFLDSVRRNPALLWSFAGAASWLLVWNAVLLLLALRSGRTLTLEI